MQSAIGEKSLGACQLTSPISDAAAAQITAKATADPTTRAAMRFRPCIVICRSRKTHIASPRMVATEIVVGTMPCGGKRQNFNAGPTA
ncbi:hypothetical protein QU42_29275 [Bradyrhizobium sp. UASWS1016]|nr:hypothetical protein QU41_16360 [Bradyrhizobium elkanii]OCX26845.1 hypothetical protein QU42_29275 [Bradyrhizobium sp. UASWS1016]